MSKIKVIIDAHAFQEEMLCDQVFDDNSGYGIVGAETMEPLCQCRGVEFEYEYHSTTPIIDLIGKTRRIIWQEGESLPGHTIISFVSGNERYYISNPEANVETIIDLYLDPTHTGTIKVCILVSFDAGQVDGIYPLRFFVRSHEAGKHHEPHIHVCDSSRSNEASIRISDGEIIAGSLPSKLAKVAKKQILANQKYYYHCWNTMSDGLKIDINHHFGIIQY